MSIAHLLEDFEKNIFEVGRVQLMDEDALEEYRLTAFEQGYSAGWDDAVSAQTEDHARVSEALGKSLEDLSFTYHEALSQMTLSLEPMFNSLMDTVLPQTIEKTYSQHIVDELKDMARDQAAQPVLLVVPSGVSAALKPALDREFSVPVQMVEESSLPSGQAYLRVGSAEREVDCTALMDSISEAVDAFLYQAKEDVQHG